MTQPYKKMYNYSLKVSQEEYKTSIDFKIHMPDKEKSYI